MFNKRSYDLLDISLNEIINKIKYNQDIILEQKDSILEFCNMILNMNDTDSTIFLAGAGRSGFVAKSFAMRLMHLGFKVRVFGETIVPPIEEGDMIIFISKSGNSKSIVPILDKSDKNIKVLSITGNVDSNITKKSNVKIIINSFDSVLSSDDSFRLKELDFNENELVLMGTDFELTSLVLTDAIVVELMHSLNLKEEDLIKNHDVLSSSI